MPFVPDTFSVPKGLLGLGADNIDPNTHQPIDGKPDLGHKHGNEFWRERDAAQKEGLTQKQFNDRMNDPKKYQLEDPASNRSHRFEKPR